MCFTWLSNCHWPSRKVVCPWEGKLGIFLKRDPHPEKLTASKQKLFNVWNQVSMSVLRSCQRNQRVPDEYQWRSFHLWNTVQEVFKRKCRNTSSSALDAVRQHHSEARPYCSPALLINKNGQKQLRDFHKLMMWLSGIYPMPHIEEEILADLRWWL